MSSTYSSETAYHYRAYRPPLHQLILAECLKGHRHVRQGIDIGCGAGHSAVALARYCRQVYALEPSTSSMLEQAIAHDQIQYQYFDGAHLDFKPASTDLITLAGSWYYAQSQALVDDILKVATPNVKVILYDFRIDTRSILKALNVDIRADRNYVYDYRINFSTYDYGDLLIMAKWDKSYFMPVSAEEMAHLLLASRRIYSHLAASWTADNLFEYLVQQLLNLGPRSLSLSAQAYVTMYRRNQGW